MNPFADPKQMKKLEEIFLENYDKLKATELSPEEQIESQKHAWGL